jgi:HK97 family phage portal protein
MDRRMSTVPQRLAAAFKGLFTPAAPLSPWYLGDLHGGAGGPWYTAPTAINYQAEAGPPDSNAVVMACINWVSTTFPEAPIRVQRTTGTQTATIADHALTALLEWPNPYYTGLDLWAATLADYNITGNGYWIAPLNRAGRPVELWYEPHFSIRPRGTPDQFIAWYEIYRAGAWLPLDPRENLVIHFRNKIDPQNPRYGISPLRAAYREIYTDEAAAGWSATLLRNTGIPGVIIAPKGSDVLAKPEVIKQAYMANFSGDRRGEPMVMTKPTDVYKLDWSPAEMDLTAIRRLPEERISALLGVPAIVAGLGAGLDRATYANFEAAEEKGWKDNISPTQMRCAATLQHRLLPLLGNPATERVSFDTTQVRALSEDQNHLYTRLAIGYDSGWLKRSEARQGAGWAPAPDGSDEIYKPGPDTAGAPLPPLTGGAGSKALVEAEPSKALALRRNGHGEDML